jgi:hypothetical protein
MMRAAHPPRSFNRPELPILRWTATIIAVPIGGVGGLFGFVCVVGQQSRDYFRFCWLFRVLVALTGIEPVFQP